jgi:hypothetical protein
MARNDKYQRKQAVRAIRCWMRRIADNYWAAKSANDESLMAWYELSYRALSIHCTAITKGIA